MKVYNNQNIIYNFFKKNIKNYNVGNFINLLKINNGNFDGYQKYFFPQDAKNIDYFASFRAGELIEKKFNFESEHNIYINISQKYSQKNTNEEIKFFLLFIIAFCENYSIKIINNIFKNKKSEEIFLEILNNPDFIQKNFSPKEKINSKIDTYFFISDNFEENEIFYKNSTKNKFFCFFDYDIFLEEKKGIYKNIFFVNTKQKREKYFKEKNDFLEKQKEKIIFFGGKFFFIGYKKNSIEEFLKQVSYFL